ncbi:MAG: DUF805 domain-containing protein [Caulobacteraceae bacterium]
MDGAPLSVAEFLFSSVGRLPRLPFIVASASCVALALIFQAVTPDALLWLGWFVYPPLIYVGSCLLAKRLHDRGRSGWWAGVLLIALIGFWIKPQGLFSFLFVIIMIWTVIELGLIAGEQGANRFGPSPLRHAAA